MSMNRDFDLDESRYADLIKAIGSLSGLFGEGTNANIHYRTVEGLFVHTTNAKDLTRKDRVFDAIVGRNFDIGVGIKTFALANSSATSKIEKVQELTKVAGRGELRRLSPKKLVHKVAEIRNKTIRSDCIQFGIDISKSIYHCLIRVGDAAYIHEEAYPIIQVDHLAPTNSNGKKRIGWERTNFSSTLHFTDGQHQYSFHTSKNTLSMRFNFPDLLNAKRLVMPRIPNIWDVLDAQKLLMVLKSSKANQNNFSLVGGVFDGRPGIDFVVLPLYSNKSGTKRIEEKSGINFWNAGGRRRKYGEAYIPVPQMIHNVAPRFFPKRGTYFSLRLPDERTLVRAGLFQEGGKALMSERNNELCRWLYRVLDPDMDDNLFDRPPQRRPFIYTDLMQIGSDCVIISKIRQTSDNLYSLQLGKIGDFERFQESVNQ